MMLGVRLEKDGKCLRIYPHKNGVAVLAYFNITREWWEQVNMSFTSKIYAHILYQVGLTMMYISEVSISEAYKKINRQKWYKDGETMEFV